MYNIKCKNKYEMELQLPSLQDRYSKLDKSQLKNVVYLKEQFDNSTFRYRTYNVLETMENSTKYSVHTFLINELKYLYNAIKKIDIIILQRAKWSFELQNFVSLLKKNNKIIIYDMDDLIYNSKYVPAYINSIGDYREFAIDSFFALAKRYEIMINQCDGAITTTDSLAKHITSDLNIPVWQINNYLNKEQIIVSQDICNLKKQMENDNKFVIGYFSGSNSHRRDLEVAEEGLIKLMNKYDNVYLRIVGYMDLSSELLKLKKKKKVEFMKFVSYEELQYEIGKVNLNIIPLQKHDFNECKSELKYFEASIVDTLSLATDNSVYSNIIVDGENGFLTNELSWFEKLEYIYLNYGKMDIIVNNANSLCHELYDYDKQKNKLESIYDDILLKLGDRNEK